MKKISVILLLIFFLLAQFIHAQDSLKIKPITSYQNNIGVFFHSIFDYHYENVYSGNYNIGIGTYIKLNNRLSLNTAVSYGDEKHYFGLSFRFWDGRAYANWIETKSINPAYHLRFNITNREDKILLYGFGGTGFKINFYEKHDFGLCVPLEVKKIKFYNCRLITGIGFEYEIKKIALNIESYFGMPIWCNCKWPAYNVTAQHPGPRIGINTGLIYKWKKI